MSRRALLPLVALLASGCFIRTAGPERAFRPPAEEMALAALVPAQPSPGCTSGQGTAEGWRTFRHGGRLRHYLLRLPPDRKPHDPLPLLVNLHGWLEGARAQDRYTGLGDAALARGIAVVNPEGISWSWSAGGCCGRALNEQVDDEGYVEALVAALGRDLCLDRARIWGTGISNGGFLLTRAVCHGSKSFAALAPVASATMAGPCTPAQPVPLLAVHGDLDWLVPTGGSAFGMQPREAWLADWAARNGCKAPPTREVWKGGEVQCRAAEGCPKGAEVVSCTVGWGGHTWPGATPMPFLGPTSRDLDTTTTVLDFFLAHPRR